MAICIFLLNMRPTPFSVLHKPIIYSSNGTILKGAEQFFFVSFDVYHFSIKSSIVACISAREPLEECFNRFTKKVAGGVLMGFGRYSCSFDGESLTFWIKRPIILVNEFAKIVIVSKMAVLAANQRERNDDHESTGF